MISLNYVNMRENNMMKSSCSIYHLSIPTAAGDEEVPGQKLRLEDIGLVARVELEHFPGEELVGDCLTVGRLG